MRLSHDTLRAVSTGPMDSDRPLVGGLLPASLRKGVALLRWVSLPTHRPTVVSTESDFLRFYFDIGVQTESWTLTVPPDVTWRTSAAKGPPQTRNLLHSLGEEEACRRR